MQPIAHYEGDLPSKFGIPRQSGRVPALRGRIVFLPEFRDPKALRGIEGFSHLWLIWDFSLSHRDGWSPTVRPPRLGGNTRMGVFATRSPFRPNPIGLSCVELIAVEDDPVRGKVLLVGGADLVSGTPIFDIKPYLPSADSHPDARGGFADAHLCDALAVDFPPEIAPALSPEQRAAIASLLREDPRPAYQDDPAREYCMEFAEWEVVFTVEDGTAAVKALRGLSKNRRP